MREPSIYGKYVNVICHCTYDKHQGALNEHLLRKKHCIAKDCPHLEIVNKKEFERLEHHAKKEKHYKSNCGK